MSSSIRTSTVLAALAALTLAGCRQADPADAPGEKAAAAVTGPAAAPRPAAEATSASRSIAEAEAGTALAEIVLEREDITVNGEPACALSVRYDEGFEQPVTWRGESCDKVLVRLASIADLQAIRQDAKLDDEARDDLARMPGKRAIYIEGSSASALYPENVMDRIYEVPLAD